MVQMFARGQLVEQRRRREREPGLLHGGGAVAERVESEQGRAPGRPAQESGEDPEQGRLARSVRTDESDDLAAVDGQVDVDERGAGAEASSLAPNWLRSSWMPWLARAASKPSLSTALM